MRAPFGAGSRTRPARTCAPGCFASSRTSTSTRPPPAAPPEPQPLEEGDYFLYNRMERDRRGGSDEERIDERLSQDDIVCALSAVPHDFRDVIVLVDIGDFSYADAAQILDIPIGTVMSRLHRGRRSSSASCAEKVGSRDEWIRRVQLRPLRGGHAAVSRPRARRPRSTRRPRRISRVARTAGSATASRPSSACT